MIKFRIYFDKDAETRWLNEMSQKGYAMTGFCMGFYSFEECSPGKYQYQIDFGKKFGAVEEDYREFMNEAGVEIVQTWGWWIILRKLASEGEFRLYTDVDSTIEHYRKITIMLKAALIIEWCVFWVELLAAAKGVILGYPVMLIILLIMIGMAKGLISAKRIIAELKERKGEPTHFGRGKVSPLLLIGMLLNSGALLSKQTDIYPEIFIPIELFAIVLMVIGIYRSRDVF